MQASLAENAAQLAAGVDYELKRSIAKLEVLGQSSSLASGDLRAFDAMARRIVVADRGVGIDSHLQARIFEPFFSTDRGSGHGLGLAFCERVIHSAGGSIRVKSELTRGACFTVELPVLGR